MQEVYIKPYKNNKLEGKQKVLIKDIATVSGPKHLKGVIEEICIFKPQVTKITHFVISTLKIIEAIQEKFPDVSVQNVGELDAMLEFNPVKPKPHPVWEWIKLAVVCIVVFAGATVAIMAYNTDVSMAKTFTTLYKVFTGEVSESPAWITIPYAIGMPIGVITFYNHIGTKKITEDPTPVEVEINAYQDQVEDTIIDVLTAEKRGQYEE
ncbi:MAG: stage V sporulation protein AA [Niameybacter sp.]|uniref:stage V sporulation protein AA n=1 Tax=Niameybacter sp. TaxID=2033640 RepID=UPI002FCAF69D